MASYQPESTEGPSRAPRASAERRQLTVMFCDLVDSTALATQLGPEAYLEVIRTYHAICVAIVERFGGYIAQYLGDGLLLYFGYPLAYEDAPQRAIRAALGVIEALRLAPELSPPPGTTSLTVPLQVRIGIHTGLVVIGEIGARNERLALGEAPNLAARIQSLALPATVVISEATWRLVQGWFICEPLGLQTFKGFAQPIAVHRVLRASGLESRLDVTGLRGFTPLIGREAESGLLQELWSQVKGGQGQTVLLSGEAGIGKSRLVRMLREYAASGPHFSLECRCSPDTQHSALYPVIRLLHNIFKVHENGGASGPLAKIEAALARMEMASPETVALLASLLSLPLEARYPELTLTPERRKQKIQETLLTLLLTLAAQRPVLCIVEDLHWVDPSTLELLTLLLPQVTGARLLLLLVCRSEFHLPAGVSGPLTHLTLQRLSPPHATLIATQVAGHKALPHEVLQQIVSKTDGVPLFVEELTKMVLESEWLQEGATGYTLLGALPALAIPATLHDSLMARLDRLAAAKTIAQLGAVIGRQFAYALLQAVSPEDEATLQQALARLVEAELLYQNGVGAQATYTFKHALIQEAAYDSLLKSTRQQYHQRIARALAERLPTTVATAPELLAYHYTEAGLLEEAVQYWLRAGTEAVARSAPLEAMRHLNRGLEVLRTLPPSPGHAQHELSLCLALGPPLAMIKGHTAPEVEQTYAQAHVLCQQVGDSQQRFTALLGLWMFALNQAQLLTAHDLAAQCLELAASLHDISCVQEAHVVLGTTSFYRGDFVLARSHLEQGKALFPYCVLQGRAYTRVREPKVTCLAHTAVTLWALGFPDQALAHSQEALALAQATGYPYDLGFALHFAALLRHSRREASEVQTLAEAVAALAREQGFVRWLGGSFFWRGWGLALQGAAEEGITQIRQGLETWHRMGGELGLPRILAMLAEAYHVAGALAAGRDVLADALMIAHRNAECRDEAELYRLSGEGCVQAAVQAGQGDTARYLAEAEAHLQRAIALAQQQHAKSLELRATVSLGRLWQQQGKARAAYEQLAPLVHWFTEGFETPDLRAARALLETLP